MCKEQGAKYQDSIMVPKWIVMLVVALLIAFLLVQYRAAVSMHTPREMKNQNVILEGQRVTLERIAVAMELEYMRKNGSFTFVDQKRRTEDVESPVE